MNVFKRVQHGVESATYYCRFQVNGEDVRRNTGQTTKAEAEKWAKQLAVALRSKRAKEALAATAQRQRESVAGIIDRYLEAGCPDRRLTPREGDSFDEQKRNLINCRRHLGSKSAELITLADFDDYFKLRQKEVQAGPRKGTGARTVDIELGCLANAYQWALRRRLVERNPLRDRTKYVDGAKVRHCRFVMPQSALDLHNIAAWFLAQPRSEVLGWQLLLEAFTGMRTEETLALRVDAQRLGTYHEPGFIDERCLYVSRSKRGINPAVLLDDPTRPLIRPLLERILAWKAVRYPRSPYLLPGKDGFSAVLKSSLTRSLKRACEALGVPQVTSHGLRAYYTTTRRGQNISDDQIGFELGHRSGAEMVRRIYGDPPANWQGLANHYAWLPQPDPKRPDADLRPAWERFEAQKPNIITVPFKAA